MLAPKTNFMKSLTRLVIAEKAYLLLEYISTFEVLNSVFTEDFAKNYYNVIGILYQ